MTKKVHVYLWGIFIVLCGLVIGGCSPHLDGPERPSNAEQAIVKRVVDGDTFVLDDGRRVRMIGINTPESVDPRRPVEFYGKEASLFTKKLLEGNPVYLEWGRTPKDRYDRWLAWVWLPDGTFVNGHLVAEGYAQVYTFKDNPDHADYLLELQRQAREAGRGLWSQSPPEEAEVKESAAGEKFVASKNSQVYHEVGCPGAKAIEKHNEVLFDSEEEAIASGRRMCKVTGCTKG
ncbi:thermonuclease family protein [Ammoniphilus sp. YIM 78166]|uniref:thermonuclease family protein n=1 Tax=Ammoniphilus sp. YIM 78166 TaxID=1644106 RepID=UPI00106FFCBE|nr:thermonuclease family protein [Ammoniphilus sp. YIM 78166]